MISIHQLYKTYRRGTESVEAVSGIDLEIEKGEFVVILGPSGGGKSTLLNLIGGIDRPTSGTVIIYGFALENASEENLTRFRRDHIGFVFQFYNLLSALNAVENVSLPLMAKGMAFKQANLKAAQILTRVGLENRFKHLPSELSGGSSSGLPSRARSSPNPSWSWPIGKEIMSFFGYIGLFGGFAGVATAITLTNLVWRLAWLHRREFGIARPLGFCRISVVIYLLTQASLILLLGAVVGGTFAFVLVILRIQDFSAFGIAITPTWGGSTIGLIAFVNLLISGTGVIFSARKINSMTTPELLGRD